LVASLPGTRRKTAPTAGADPTPTAAFRSSNETDDHMTDSRQKVVQYLEEARGSEVALVRELQAQIAMTPRGAYRSLLEKHLRETRSHADRLRGRLEELDHASNPLEIVGGVAQMVVGQVLALGRAPLALVRGGGGEEKVLKNAKDSCAAEALEIATYIALERLATDVDDERTAKLAASIREDEERMLERLRAELPKLTDAVVRAELHDDPSYDLGTIGAVDAVRSTAEDVKETAREVGDSAKRATRQARKVPGVAQAEGEIKGMMASEDDLAITGYDDLTAEQINEKLGSLSQIDLARIDAYERRTQNRTTVLGRIDALRGDEPWPGYDEQNVSEITTVLREADEDLSEKVRAYEKAHKNRASVLKATERKLAAVS
jgi:ferritin-like metal-binding protein YciE